MAEKEKDFQITAEEASKLRKALKDEEFRKLLSEYAQEISDPENRAKYERELAELEKQRGVNVKFIRPTAGFVLKIFTTPEGNKIFINVCQSDTVNEATPTRIKDKGDQWMIPYSLTPPRDDLDKAGKKCIVVDAAFHPETYKKGQQNPRFKKLLVDTVVDGIEGNLKMKLDRATLVYLRMPYKGMPTATVIRERTKEPSTGGAEEADQGPLKVPYPPLREEVEAKSHKKQQERKAKEKPPTQPEYTVVHRGEMTMQDFTNERSSSRIRRPKELVVTVHLPGVSSAKSVELDIFEKRLLLQCNKPLYKLDLALPYPVDEDKGGAKFNKSKKSLVITLPVLPLPRPPVTPPDNRPLVTELTCSDESSERTNQAEESESHDTEEVSAKDKKAESVENVVGGDWSSVGEWELPPFNYHQDDSTVFFVLYTARVKRASMVSHFDEHMVQLTYRTVGGQSYSFCVTFPSECGLDCDDCRIDIGEDNLVIVLAKNEESSDKEWEGFNVSLKSAQPEAENKLFLTTNNVQRALEEMDDPWEQRAGWSESAKVEVTALSEEQMNVKVTDENKPPSTSPPTTVSSKNTVEMQNESKKGEDSVQPGVTETGDDDHHSQPQVNSNTGTEGSDPEPEPAVATRDVCAPKEATEELQTNEMGGKKGSETETVVDKKSQDIDSTHGGESAVVGKESKSELQEAKHSEDGGLKEREQVSVEASGGGGRGELVNGSSVVVESDGSIFVRAEKDYTETRPLQQVATNVEKGPKIQFSNHLAFSMD